MALTKCRACFSTILELAPACPRCGDARVSPHSWRIPVHLLALLTASLSIATAAWAVFTIQRMESRYDARLAALQSPPALTAPTDHFSSSASTNPTPVSWRYFGRPRHRAWRRHRPDWRAGMAGAIRPA